ncbi:MAG: DUF2344 domain-containing protein [Cellulosilyticum sp.]|nr:DUF2344 domain-containing protein [Cellulosilyticum sp.]
MKVRVKFSKIGKVKYVGHLDTMRLFQRAIKVADFPVSYSQGFSPHSLVYFALPLAVGMSSEGEYMEIVMDSHVPPQEVKERLQKVLVDGITLQDVYEVEEKSPSLMSMVQGADYSILLSVPEQPEITAASLEQMVTNQEELIVLKRGKKGIAPVDIKPLILKSHFSQEDEQIRIELQVYAGSSKNLNPDLFVKAVLGETAYTMQVSRKELYTEENGKLVPICAVGRIDE